MANALRGASPSVSLVRLPPSLATALSAHATTHAYTGSPVRSVTAHPSAAAPKELRNATAICVSNAHVFATNEFMFTKDAHEIHPKCIESGTCVVQYRAADMVAAAARSARCATPSAAASATSSALLTQK